MSYETLIYEKQGHQVLDRTEYVAHVTLNRPHVLNARNRQMRLEIVELMASIDADPTVRVMILGGAGEKAFCVGRDLNEVAAGASAVQTRADKLREADAEAIARLRVPSIAAIHGFCVGGGLELALACDVRVATEDARLGFPEVSRGLIPGNGGTQRLPRLIGVGRAAEMILSGRLIDAAEAERIGLANRVVPRQELLKAAEQMAEMIASRSPLALSLSKEALYTGLDETLEQGIRRELELSALVQSSQDAVEGAQAFLEKRSPRWTGR